MYDGQGGTEQGQSGTGNVVSGGNGSGGIAAGVFGGTATGDGAGTGGTGGLTGAAGSQGGTEDMGVPDASVPLGDSGCLRVPLYRDRDGDGYGSSLPEDEELGCALEGYVTLPGDRNDESSGFFDRAELVHPGQTEFFGFSYEDESKPGGVSFDFDCSGAEEADPDNSPSGAPPDCASVVAILDCSGQGFRDEGRTGPGIIGQCGSELIISCSVQNVTQCVAVEAVVAIGNPFSCR